MYIDLVRKLARDKTYQLLYVRSKDIPHIRLFRNEMDFTEIQMLFLQWLEIYNSLYIDLAIDEDNISQYVIDDDIRCDAYLYWKGNKNKKLKEQKRHVNKPKDKSTDKIIFTRPRGNK